MDIREVIFHFLRIKQNKETESLEFFHKLRLLVFAIHGQPSDILDTIDEALQYDCAYFDDELGDIEKQCSMVVMRGDVVI